VSSDFYQHPELYDALFPIGAHLPFYLDLARGSSGGVLELAVGTGLLAVPMAEAGLPTFGLDRSGAMLARARRRADAARVALELIEGDMRDFDLHRRFGLIFVARNSLLHVTPTADLVATFASVRRHLAPSGTFAFDVFNPDVRILARPAGQRFPVMNVPTELFGSLTVEGTHHYDSAQQVDNGTWYISAAEDPDKWVVSIQVRSIFPQELPLLLEAGGLRLVRRFGDLSTEQFGAGSPRQVCVCEAAA
jgi:SAM-dependent methyltransferase